MAAQLASIVTGLLMGMLVLRRILCSQIHMKIFAKLCSHAEIFIFEMFSYLTYFLAAVLSVSYD